MTLNYNDIAQVEETFAAMGSEIACVIVEPVAGNMNCIPPVAGFLESLREQCTKYDAVLIFDEVMTGFRVGSHGAQGHYKIEPDITTLGKVIGGGMPVGAFGGKLEIMQRIAPEGPVYQAGTLSGNPVAMAAGLKTLQKIQQNNFYPPLFARTQQLCAGLEAAAKECRIPFITNHIGTMWGGFFTDESEVTNYQQVMACNTERFNRFFHLMLEGGVYLAPASYEAAFMSAAHSNADIEFTVNAAKRAFAAL